MPKVNNTVADIGIQSLNPLSDLKTPVADFIKEIPIFRIRGFLKSKIIVTPEMLSKDVIFIMSLTSLIVRPIYLL